MIGKYKIINNKKFRVYKAWFCSKCYYLLPIEKAPIVDIEVSSPKALQKAISTLGFELSCKKCGNKTFVTHEFKIPIQDILDEYLDKAIKEFIKQNLNPSVRPNEKS